MLFRTGVTATIGPRSVRAASDAGDEVAAGNALRRASDAAPHAPRPLIVAARLAAKRGDAASAFELYTELLQHAPALFPLVASDYATAAIGCGQTEAARAAEVKARPAH